MRILLVDDDLPLAKLAARILGELGGHEVTCAAGGRDGLARAEAGGFDLVLLDWTMPDLDGPAVLGRLRADPRTRALPVLFLTAKTDPGTIQEARRLGAAGCAAKPFDPEVLLEQIRVAAVRRTGP